MKQEYKDILVKDLSARLSYGVKMYVDYIDFNKIGKLFSINNNEELILSPDTSYPFDITIEKCKPYLFPLSSMTEEQKEELFNLCEFCIREDWEGKKSEIYAIEIASRLDPAYCYDHTFNIWSIDMRAINWFLKNHFDINGLIPKGLAIDATSLNIYN